MSNSQFPIPNSTYGLRVDFSYKSEGFYYISLTWRLGISSIDCLKIRFAHWKPKFDRSNQAVFYYDVKTKDEAKNILYNYQNYDFKAIENLFESMWKQDTFDKNVYFNTGETRLWLQETFLPVARAKFKPLAIC